MVRPFGLIAHDIRLGVLRRFHVPNVGQWFAWRSTKPKIGVKSKLRCKDDPDNATARLFQSLTLAALPSTMMVLN